MLARLPSEVVLALWRVLTKHELLSAIIHGVFLMEALSVITQVGSFQIDR